MRYLSVDIETTGLDPSWCQMIEFGAVFDDCFQHPIEELPTFHCYIVYERYIGEAIALSMHAEILKRIHNRTPGYNYWTPAEAFDQFENWLLNHIKLQWWGLNIAGKNFGPFDLQFIKQIWPHFRCRYRFLDLGSCFYNPLHDQDGLPNLQTCMERSGIETKVQHTALEDAMDVVRALRVRYSGAIESLSKSHRTGDNGPAHT